MKKIFSIIAAVLFAGSMMAETVDFSKQGYENGQAIEKYTGTNFTITFDKGTNSNAPRYYTTGAAIRCYGANTFTVASSKNITKIVLTFASGEGTNEITATPGTFATDTWTGEAKSVTFTIGGTTGHRRIATITVTVDGEEEGGEGGGQGGGGEQELTDPTNCAEAREAALSVSGNNVMYNGGKVYTIEGYVTSIAFALQDGSMSFWMADTKNGGNVLEAYKCAVENEADAPKVGDKVAVTGKLTKYGTTPEFAAGCTVEIIERGEVVEPKNLGEKTIEEFLALKNTIDTCVLTGTVKNIVMDKEDPTVPNKYGNFDLEDETGSVYVYGLLTAAGESQKFVEMGIKEGDVLTILALYNEYNSKPQVKNGIYVSHVPGDDPGTAIDNTAVEVKAQKVVRDGQLLIIRNGVVFNANGTIVK